MEKIVMLSHCPSLPTGYGRVIRHLAHAFQGAGHDVSVIGVGSDNRLDGFAFRVLPLGFQQAEDAIAAALQSQSPDVLFTLGDPWMFELLPQVAELCTVTWICYFAIDGYPIPPEWLNWLGFADIPVVFSRWAQRLVAESIGTEPALIYHGVDTNLFAPADKSGAKTALGIQPDAFVVGCVAVNQQRKNLPALLKAFAHFAREKPNAVLYLHTKPVGTWDLPALSRQYGIANKITITQIPSGEPGLSDSAMANLYNAFDIFCLPTMAEGFGLPVLEAQACGVPALVTDCSACSELVANPVQLLSVRATLAMNRGLEQAVVDHLELASKLDYFYHRPQDLPLRGMQCRRFAERFDWSVILPQFLRLIESTAQKPKEASLRFFVA